jgi:hypothetical protein
VHGQGGTAGVWGECANNIGVYGTSANSTGVYGQGAIAGVTGIAGSATGLGGMFTGGRAPLLLTPAGTAGAPSSGTHSQGEQLVDANGQLYLCTAQGTPGTWQKLSSVVPIPPVRVMNTRPAKQIGPYKGPIANNTVLTLTLGGTNGIPSNATGVMGNLTAADATGSCFLAVVPAGANHLGVSTINFPTQAQGTGLANAFTVGLSGGKIDIYTGNCSSYSVNIIMDITGFII